MAKTGKKRTPEPTLRLHGGFRPDRAPKTVIVGDCPEPPHWLSRGAKGEWHRVSGALHAAGLLNAADRMAFASYCIAYDDYRVACREVEALGDKAVVKTKSGYLQQSPWVATKERAEKRLLTAAGHFGLTPATRASLPTPTKPAEDLDALADRIIQREKGRTKHA